MDQRTTMATQQIAKIPISSSYTQREREVIAEEIIDFIIERTQKQSLDKNNNKFPGYSKSYKESLDFKVGGKTSKVNLTLSGEMLGELKYLKGKDTTSEIAIGFPQDAALSGKVEGNRIGSYGGEAKASKARDFLGIHPDDLRKILDKYPPKDRETRGLAVAIAERLRREAEALARGVELEEEYE